MGRSRGDPLTIESVPFVAGAPRVVSTKIAHLNALESVLPPTAMSHARALPPGDLIGAMSGADISAVIRACFRDGAGEEEEERIQELVNDCFMGMR